MAIIEPPVSKTKAGQRVATLRDLSSVALARQMHELMCRDGIGQAVQAKLGGAAAIKTLTDPRHVGQVPWLLFADALEVIGADTDTSARISRLWQRSAEEYRSKIPRELLAKHPPTGAAEIVVRVPQYPRHFALPAAVATPDTDIVATNPQEFAALLRLLQVRSGLTAAKIANFVGMPRSTAYALISKDRTTLPARGQMVADFVRGCGLPPDKAAVVMTLWGRLNEAKPLDGLVPAPSDTAPEPSPAQPEVTEVPGVPERRMTWRMPRGLRMAGIIGATAIAVTVLITYLAVHEASPIGLLNSPLPAASGAGTAALLFCAVLQHWLAVRRLRARRELRHSTPADLRRAYEAGIEVGRRQVLESLGKL